METMQAFNRNSSFTVIPGYNLSFMSDPSSDPMTCRVFLLEVQKSKSSETLKFLLT
jgi:hypothetical protein